MVAYHAINYSAFRPLAFEHLAFLPPSFILITGFIVGQIYAKKYDATSWTPYLRLMTRGAKLLAIFVLLNLGNCMVSQHSVIDGFWELGDRAAAIFISGNGRNGIFEVLLPISYFLLLSPALLWLRTRVPWVTVLFASAVVGICAGFERHGYSWNNLNLLSSGFIGLALGLIRQRNLDRMAILWVPALACYVIYRFLSYRLGDLYLVQMMGAATAVFLLYSSALHLRLVSRAGRRMVTMGKYSLLGYLAQIAMLKVLVRVFGGKPSHWSGVIEIGLATCLLLFVLIEVIHAMRKRNRPLDSAYKAIFV